MKKTDTKGSIFNAVVIGITFAGMFCWTTNVQAQEKTVQVKAGDKSYRVEVSEIKKDKDGDPTVTIYSNALNGSISYVNSNYKAFVTVNL